MSNVNNIVEDLQPLVIDIDGVKPDPQNARRHPAASIEALRRSLVAYGQRKPITVNGETGVIEAGNGLWQAAKSLGWTKIAAVRVADSDATSKGYALMDNQSAMLSEWDLSTLDDTMDELRAMSYDISLTGFDDITLKGLFDSVPEVLPVGTPDAEPQVDRADALREQWKVEKGQLWLLGDHRLLCGDSTKREDVDRVMAGEKASVCLTDPPYGLGGDKASGKNSYDEYNDTRANLEDLARNWLPIAREVAPVVCFSPGVTNAWIYPEASWVMCWFYGGGQLRSSWGFNCWQPFLCYGKDPSLASGNGCRPDAVDMNTPANAGDIDHPCPKPTKLWAWLIERLSFDRTDTFYEPFSGSGTTIIACEQLGRKCRAIEISPGYVAVALQRFKDATGDTPQLEANT